MFRRQDETALDSTGRSNQIEMGDLNERALVSRCVCMHARVQILHVWLHGVCLYVSVHVSMCYGIPLQFDFLQK